MSRYNLLKGITHNIVHKFSVSAEHFAYLAYLNKVQTAEIDLLNNLISPIQFDPERNRILVGYCRDALIKNLENLKIAPVKSANWKWNSDLTM